MSAYPNPCAPNKSWSDDSRPNSSDMLDQTLRFSSVRARRRPEAVKQPEPPLTSYEDGGKIMLAEDDPTLVVCWVSGPEGLGAILWVDSARWYTCSMYISIWYPTRSSHLAFHLTLLRFELLLPPLPIHLLFFPMFVYFPLGLNQSLLYCTRETKPGSMSPCVNTHTRFLNPSTCPL